MSVRNRAGGARDDVVVTRLHALAPLVDVEPDPAWQGATRARLVAMAAVRSPEPEHVSPLRRVLADGPPAAARWRARLTAGLAGAALSVTAMATLVAAASEARPGAVLYDLKRGTEQTRLALAGDARGEVLLGLATTRLEEVRALVDAGAVAWSPTGAAAGPGRTVLAAEHDAALVVETLATMDAQTAAGAAALTRRAVDTGAGGPLELLADWAVTQTDGLEGVRDAVPAAAEDDVVDSLVLLADLSARADALETSLQCTDGPAVRGADELGPLPAACPHDGVTSTSPGGAAGGSPGASDSRPAPGTGPPPGPSTPSQGGVVPQEAGGAEGGLPTTGVPPLPPGAVPTDVPPGRLPLPRPLPPVPATPPPVPGSLSPLPGSPPPLPARPLPGAPGTDPSAGPTPPLPVDVCQPPLLDADC